MPQPQFMTEPTPNLPLLRKILDQIDNHPTEWFQGAFAIRGDALVDELAERDLTAPACGTAYCIAGWAVVLSGHTLRWDTDSDETIELSDGRDIPDVARYELGITEHEAAYLFEGGNDRDAVQEFAEQIADRAGETL